MNATERRTTERLAVERRLLCRAERHLDLVKRYQTLDCSDRAYYEAVRYVEQCRDAVTEAEQALRRAA